MDWTSWWHWVSPKKSWPNSIRFLFWGYLKNEVYKNPRPLNVQEMRDKITLSARNVLMDLISKVCRSVTSHCHELIAVDGLHFEHLRWETCSKFSILLVWNKYLYYLTQKLIVLTAYIVLRHPVLNQNIINIHASHLKYLAAQNTFASYMFHASHCSLDTW